MRWIAGLLLLLAGCAHAPPPPAEPVAYVTRHYDTPAGERDPDLTATGAARAQALARRFAGKPLAAIYVTGFKRTAQTVAPLAAARGLTPQVYGPTPDAAFLAAVRAAPGPVLIVGHSNTVPDIVAALGGERPGPLAHPDFGDLWTVTGGTATRERVAP